MLKATEKDMERADGLQYRGNSWGNANILPNAKKMAKAIKNPDKILGRMEAVYIVWGKDAAYPFAEKAAELHPGSELAQCFQSAKHAMNVAPSGIEDPLARIAYNCSFTISNFR